MFEISGKCIIVTGGAQGVGRALTLSMVERGGCVCFCDIQHDKAEETLKEIQQKTGITDRSRLCFFPCDVSKSDDWVSLWTFAETTLGGQVEILVNNAAVGPQVRSYVFKITCDTLTNMYP